MRFPKKPKIHSLVLKGDREAIELELNRGADPNRTWVDRLTAFHLAVDEINFELVQKLVAAGGDPTATFDPHNQDALQLAAQRGATEIVRFLAEQGVDPSRRDDKGWTAAASGGEGTLTSVQLLISLGVDIDALTEEGETALILAAIASNLAVAQHLLNAGAALSPVASYGWDALRAANEQLTAALKYPGEPHQIRVDRDLVRILTGSERTLL